ncbi:MAG: GNAT family N-acetyltransferase [Chloroflexota bacterium]
MQRSAPYGSERGPYLISTDPERLDPDVIHGFLSHCYWGSGRSRATVVESLRHSLNFGLYRGTEQVGLARVITDYATFAYLCDFFIVEGHRDQGLGVWLIQTVVAHPRLRGLRRFLLATRDAHGLYRKVGFQELAHPEGWMAIEQPNR